MEEQKYVKRFPSGAVRSSDKGKIRVDFISPYALQLIAQHFSKNSDEFNGLEEFGANYFKGIEPKNIQSSLSRHWLDFNIAVLEKDEKLIKEELTAIASNAIMGLHCILKKEKGLYKEIYDKIEYVPALKDSNPKYKEPELYNYTVKGKYKTQDLGDSLYNPDIWPDPFKKPDTLLGLNFQCIGAESIPYKREALLPQDQIENEIGDRLQYLGFGKYRFVTDSGEDFLSDWFSKWRKI